jgi:tetratricopeptide (TPR) repeat protein
MANKIEHYVQKQLRFRRFIYSLTFLAILVLVGFAGWKIWESSRQEKFVLPTYENLDVSSLTYWAERAQFDIDSSRGTNPNERTNAKQRFFLQNTLQQVTQLPSKTERNNALMDIGVTLAKNDVDLNIDDFLKPLSETPAGQSLLARILVSQALMYLRLENTMEAANTVKRYFTIVNEADVKIDSEVNELSFCGAVTALRILKDTTFLSEMFNRQIAYSDRLPTVQKMMALRCIAGEQARVNSGIYAMNTVKKIKTPLELSRAYQLIIGFTAREQEVKAVEPVISLPQTQGPWNPLPSLMVAEQIVQEVLKQIAEMEDLDTQIDVMMQLAGSRLMCDPQIHKVFRDAVSANQQFDKFIKRPVLKLLDEPESPVIRASLGLPPLSQDKIKTVDPALDNWKSPIGAIAVDVSVIAPETTETINSLQLVRLYNKTAQCYLMVNRKNEAVAVLKKAYQLNRSIPFPLDRAQNYLKIGEKQLTAGDSIGAKASFLSVGLPTGTKSSPDAASEEGEVYNEKFLSDLAYLQIIGRFFDNAAATIKCIKDSAERDDKICFIVQEQFRVGSLADAEKNIALISNEKQKATMSENLNIAKANSPETKKSAIALIDAGLLDTALAVVGKITDSKIKADLQVRIISEYMLRSAAYRGDTESHRKIRQRLFDLSASAARSIEPPIQKAAALENIIASVLDFDPDNRKAALLTLLTEAYKETESIKTAIDDKGEIMSRLILHQITLNVTKGQEGKLPLIDEKKDTAPFDAVIEKITAAIKTINEMSGSAKRGMAIANLSKALIQIGRNKAALNMLKKGEETAVGLQNAKDAVSILLSFVPIYCSVNETESAAKIYYTAFNVIMEAYAKAGGDDLAVEWRKRDSELDRIIRSQLEQDYVSDATIYASRINEPQLKDRLFRTAAYIFLDKNKVLQSEVAARKIQSEAVLIGTVRDVLFVKRRTKKLEEPTLQEQRKAKEIEEILKGGKTEK